MNKAQKELTEEKEVLDRRLKEITDYYGPDDYKKPKEGESSEVQTQYAQLSARQKELEKQLGDFPVKEK